MNDVKEKALPKHLQADRIGKPTIFCRIGLHDWRWKEEFGVFGYGKYQERYCIKCGRRNWQKIGYNVHD